MFSCEHYAYDNRHITKVFICERFPIYNSVVNAWSEWPSQIKHYRMEENFGGRKLWQIHYKNMFGEFGKFVQLTRHKEIG